MVNRYIDNTDYPVKPVIPKDIGKVGNFLYNKKQTLEYQNDNENENQRSIQGRFQISEGTLNFLNNRLSKSMESLN